MHRLVIFFVSSIAVSGAGADEPATPHAAVSTSQPSATRVRTHTDLYLARSLGGSRFAVGEGVFVEGASFPELVRLRKGGLLAVFDAGRATGSRTTLFASRSSDQGRTWTRARPVRIHEADEASGKSAHGVAGARHADILRLPNGTLRMYFTVDAPGAGCQIRSATSVDGLRFRLDSTVAASIENCMDARPGVVRVGNRFHLFVSEVGAGATSRPTGQSQGDVVHFVSRDGRGFERVGRVHLAGGQAGAAFSAHGNRIRAVVALDGSLRSITSRDGKNWKLEPDVLMTEGQNASVVEMRDGTFLMAFEHLRSARHVENRQPALVSVTQRKDRDAKESESESAADPSSSDTGDPGASDEASVDANWPTFADEHATGDEEALAEDLALASEGVDPVAESASDHKSGEDLPDAADPADEEARAEQERLARERADWLAVPDVVRPPIDSLPPLPDFATPVNYAEWYARLCDINTPDNAYWAYDEFMPSPFNLDRQKEWPTLEIMYNRTDFTEPAPWDPAALPEWESSYQASLPLLEKFEAASRHIGFARPVQFRPEDAAESPTGQPLLVGLLLPDLAAHRSLVKQTLSANWRITESGSPAPEKMIEGWRTALSSANHMHQGATLIEQLVGTAEQNLVESDARHALKHGVFKGEQLEQALTVLEQHDRDGFDTARTLQGEHAFVLDLMQAMFKADKPGDPPRPSPEAIDKILPLFGEDSKVIPEIKAMSPADVKKTVNAFETYYAEATEAMAIGYPQVRTDDMNKMAERHLNVSPMTRTLLPAFGRIQKIRARNEASRRATQLSYAVHIFKEQNGRWPQSIDELPSRFSATMRTDPFTGGQFGYRVDENGPVIYSLSENGQDDGGQHSTRWDDEKAGESDDHVFWPPQGK